MINIPTVFILGAGASKPYGFPTGIELNKKICDDFLQNYSGFIKNFPAYEQTTLPLPVTAKELYNHFNPVIDSQSIDLFLSRNYPKYYKIGILSIVYQILVSEKNSSLYSSNSQVESNWYSLLIKKITNHIKTADNFHLDLTNINIITFNYDRSLEHYLFRNLMNTFSSIVDEKEIIRELNKLNIVHIYGKVGKLQWQNDDITTIKYGCDPYAEILIKAMKNIEITYSHRKNSTDDKIGNIISNSEIIYFLGFGYNEDNLKNIGFPSFLTSNKKIYGTALGINKVEINRLNTKFKPCRSIIEDTTCLNLLNDHFI